MNNIRIVSVILIFVFVVGCQENIKWEYKVYSISSEQSFERTGLQALEPTKITISENDLNKLGSEGWELSTSFLELETAHPNFGSSEYVTGLQPNIRPQRLVMIFRRVAK